MKEVKKIYELTDEQAKILKAMQKKFDLSRASGGYEDESGGYEDKRRRRRRRM